MKEELRRHNSIGNTNGLLFLVSIMEGKEELSRQEILNRCALERNIVINCPAAIDFFEYIGLINTDLESVFPLSKLSYILTNDTQGIIKKIVVLTINKLLDSGVFDGEAVKFDAEKDALAVVFPLDYAAIRNLLITVGALREEDNKFYITNEYEEVWTKQIKARNKVSLEQLLEQQQRQSQQGIEAENFVLKLEKERLPAMSEKIRRISDLNAAAGYDIISYEKEDAIHPDRFIEVKSYNGRPSFFWSANEVNVAKEKAEKYLLCLVDYSRIEEKGYRPNFIRNPHKIIFGGSDWHIKPSSYVAHPLRESYRPK